MMPAEKFLCRCVAKVAICSSSMDKRPPIFLPNLILEEEILVKLSLEGLLQHDLDFGVLGFPLWVCKMIFLNLLNKGKCLEMEKRGNLKNNCLITTDWQVFRSSKMYHVQT